MRPKPGADLQEIHIFLGTSTRRTYPAIGGLQVIQLPPGLFVTNALAAFEASGLVLYAEPDAVVQLLSEPNDFHYYNGDLWHLKNLGQYGGTAGADIHAVPAWDLQRTASNVVVAVIDTGVRTTHEDLAPNLWVNPGETGLDDLGQDKSTNGIDDDGDGYIDDVHGINAIDGTGVPEDDYGHGSHVSGTIGAMGNNSIGVTGVAWRTQLMNCKFLDPTGNGSISDAIECIDFARLHGAQIINASWGSPTFTSAALYDAINAARTAGILFVAACGNSNNNNDVTPLFPASYDLDNIISVAATTRTDTRASFSSYGATTVDLGAPGSPIYSCWNGSDTDYRYFDGTSMAASVVSGVCALVWAQSPGLDYRAVKQRLLSTTDPLPSLAGYCVSGGRVNAFRALSTNGVTSSFTAAPLTGTAPLTVTFTDTSTGPVTSWLWNFGDGTATSSQQNPVHQYSLAGNFIASLQVSSAGGDTDTSQQTIHVTGALSVSPEGGLTSVGEQGGPFTPSSVTYTLLNRSPASLSWSAGVDQVWLALSRTGGTLTSGAQTTVKVSITDAANGFFPSNYAATVYFTNLTSGDGNTTRPVLLTVVTPADGYLVVNPSTGFTSQGPKGGPFVPASQNYAVQNTGAKPLQWTASANKSWLTVAPAGGSVASGASAPVTLSINSAANALKAGTYEAVVIFKNTKSRATVQFTVTLKVN